MGKTRVACEVLSRLLDVNDENRLTEYALVICPTIDIIETIWTDTLNLYGLKKEVLEGEGLKIFMNETSKDLGIPPLTVCLITYANINDGDKIDYFIHSPPSIIIFDEYHTLTNNSLKMDKKYRETILKLPVNLRIGLTATPFVNNDMEIVHAFGFLNDAKLIEEFILAKEKELFVRKVQKINFMFYRENPYKETPVSEWFISIPMGKEHYNQYILEKDKNSYKESQSRQKFERLSVAPELVDKKIKLPQIQSIETGKINALRVIISRLPYNDKIVIIDNQISTLKHIENLDFIQPLNPVLYFGGEKSENKNNFIMFNNKPEHKVLLTTRQKGGEGLNLQIANHIVIINCWYTVKDIIQIIGRVKRKGQKKPVYAYIFGYNLFGCLEPRMPPVSYILKEDKKIYEIIWKKKEIYKEWGMEVDTKLPLVRGFFNNDSFEKDFYSFLEGIVIKEQPKNRHNNYSKEIAYILGEEYYEDKEHIEEESDKKTYFDDLFLQYEKYINQKGRRILVKFKRKKTEEKTQASTLILSHDNEEEIEEDEVYEVEEDEMEEMEEEDEVEEKDEGENTIPEEPPEPVITKPVPIEEFVKPKVFTFKRRPATSVKKSEEMETFAPTPVLSHDNEEVKENEFEKASEEAGKISYPKRRRNITNAY